LIKYQAEFEGHLKGTKLKGNESVDDIIASLNNVSKRLGINISTKNLGSNEDMHDFSEQLTKLGKLSPKALRQCKGAMQYYVNMVNGL
jgi:ribosome-associated translation inhibitor RaiA